VRAALEVRQVHGSSRVQPDNSLPGSASHTTHMILSWAWQFSMVWQETIVE
jgi:hypothetical protein